MGGCATIGQSMINAKSGGRTRIAGIAAGLFPLIFIVYAAPVIELSPLATPVGVMFMVVIGIFARNSLSIPRPVPRTDAFAIVLITAVTVMADLATAEVVGLIVSVPAHAWNNARRIDAETYKTEDGTRVCRIRGPRFFGATDGFA
ncbi:sulfate permease, SulP family [Jhaorihella thermophila]|uniref:Sulfate permease, SulP family n=1 Tax=Jhaorihella thermophila TaxID=488547 RepID=A0A1H5YX03_9RHOB|nr:sulfate permease, SulP family [Jhaorihella thermophila]